MQRRWVALVLILILLIPASVLAQDSDSAVCDIDLSGVTAMTAIQITAFLTNRISSSSVTDGLECRRIGSTRTRRLTTVRETGICFGFDRSGMVRVGSERVGLKMRRSSIWFADMTHLIVRPPASCSHVRLPACRGN